MFRNETNHYHLEIFPADTISPPGSLTDLKPLVTAAAGISVLPGVSNSPRGVRVLLKLFIRLTADFVLLVLFKKGFCNSWEACIKTFKNLCLGNDRSLTVSPLQNPTQGRRQNPIALNTASCNNCECWWWWKGRKKWIHYPLRTTRPMEGGSCKDPEQILIRKIFNQCREQSTPFFEITE